MFFVVFTRAVAKKVEKKHFRTQKNIRKNKGGENIIKIENCVFINNLLLSFYSYFEQTLYFLRIKTLRWLNFMLHKYICKSS